MFRQTAKTVFFILLVMAGEIFLISQSSAEEGLRLYSDYFDPAEHPNRGRLFVTPPDRAAFENKTQFITLRSFPAKEDTGFDFEKTLNQYQNAELGRILWPHAGTIFFNNLDELAEVIHQRDLFLFDIWGYVPGSGPRGSGDWTQFQVDPAQFRLLEEKLGSHWLGMDNGEQDGRYIGGYAGECRSISDNRFDQYLSFQRHFERLGDELGNRLATLVSLNFGHYFLKEGIYTLIGAETAQGLPNGQVYYSWIRGAGKQYGVSWFGNASVWNRWGWKDYNGTPTEGSGPTKGTSLNLLKRLIYSHIFYNCAAVGFENGWFIGDQLGPIGVIQQSAARWLEENGEPGVMMTPAALLTDFGGGWSFPRHLYTGRTYRVWGTIPYDAGDYLTDNLFDLIYPGYQDSSYFHDETGFMTATPFGDSADTLLTDAPLWLLNRYPLVIAAGGLTPSEELRDKLTAYVENGGRLVMTAGNLARFNGGLCGISTSGPKQPQTAGTAVDFADGSQTAESFSFDLYPLDLPQGAEIISRCGDQPAAVSVAAGKGSLLVLASDFGIPNERAVSGPIPNNTDEPLATPYPMLGHVKKIMEAELDRIVLFRVGGGLGFIVCRKGANRYRVAVFNSTLEPKPLEITSCIGKIESIRELPVNTDERTAAGFLPDGSESAQIGTDTEDQIAGTSVRIFDITLTEEQVTLLEKSPMPSLPAGRTLTLRHIPSVKEAILARPTFFQHFDGVMVDWTYFASRSMEQIQREAGWIKRQKLAVTVDFSSGLNLYPDLRLTQNDKPEYERSLAEIKSVIEKCAVWGTDSILVSTHRVPENNYTASQTAADMFDAFRQISRFAQDRGITVYARAQEGTDQHTPESAAGLLDAAGDANFHLAVSPTLWNQAAGTPFEAKIQQKANCLLLAGFASDENNGDRWSEHLPLASADIACREAVQQVLNQPEVRNGKIIFDAVYENQDEEYRDVRILEDQENNP